MSKQKIVYVHTRCATAPCTGLSLSVLKQAIHDNLNNPWYFYLFAIEIDV